MIVASIIVLLVGLLTVISYAYYRLGIKVLELEEQVEESLDIIDGCYSRISASTSHPVTSDDPIVQAVVSDIRECKQAMLLIANKITTFSEQQ